MNNDDKNYEMKKILLLEKRKELFLKYNELKKKVEEYRNITKSIVESDFQENDWNDWKSMIIKKDSLKASRISRAIPIIDNPKDIEALDNFIEVVKLGNERYDLKNEKENLDLALHIIREQLSIAIERQSELCQRGNQLFGNRYSYHECSFEKYFNNYVNSAGSSISILLKTQEMEAIIRCGEAISNGLSKEKVYEKYIGNNQSKDTEENTYFTSRLNQAQKEFVCEELDHIYQDGKNTFSTKFTSEVNKTR